MNYHKHNTLGVILTLAGISYIAVIKAIIQRDMPLLSIGIVIVSLCLMINTKVFITGKYPRVPKSVALIFTYSFITVLLAFSSDTPLMASGRGGIYQAAYFLQIILLWGCIYHIDRQKFLKYLFAINCIFCIPCFYILFQTVIQTGSFYFNNLTNAQGDFIISREATATFAYTAWLSAIVYKPNRKSDKIAKIILIILSVLIMLISNRRSVYLAVMLNLVFIIRAKKEIIIKNPQKVLLASIACIVIIFFCINNKTVSTMFSHAFDSLNQSIKTYLGVNEVDRSALYRADRLKVYPHIFMYESTIMQMLFGRGYMDGWFDLPYFQAIWDLGLLGGFVYYIAIYLMPIKYLLVKSEDPVYLFTQCFTLHTLICSFVNGFPYGVFFPIVLMIGCYQQLQLEENNKRLAQNGGLQT